MNGFSQKWRETTWTTGLVFLGLQLVLFCLPLFFPQSNSTDPFFINILIAFVYYLIALFSRWFKEEGIGIHIRMMALVNLLVSAYALNRQMDVFKESTGWLCCLLVLVCINYISIYFFELLPEWLRRLQCFILGVAIVLFVYLAVYLLPLYILSAAAAIGLGISLHTFVPLLFVIFTIKLLKKMQLQRSGYVFFSAGIAVALLISITYVVVWCINLSAINKHYNYSAEGYNASLPQWVNAAGHVPQNSISEKILKTGLSYHEADLSDFSLFTMPARNFGERVKHDPLVVMCTLFGGRVNVPEEDRIKILESMYHARHQAQERLWAGDHLVTSHVHTEVELWPDLYMSYTEMCLTILNEGEAWRWSSNEEAIYTFQLPQGGVVTSLSLWIDGKEEKGILTTQAKADSAYKTIVGVERRDPSVVHWQEGNTVTVRVFPVVRGNSRKFKIGITAPLENNGNQLQYQSVYFKGPSFAHASEEIKLRFMADEKHLYLPYGFARAAEHVYVRNGRFKPDWDLLLDKLPLADKGFTFNGKNYHIQGWEKDREQAYVSQVFLDVNEGWTWKEFNKVLDICKEREVYVAGEANALVKVTAENKKGLFKQLASQRFSLFPFFSIPTSENSLVVTRGTLTSPSLQDIKRSDFMKQLRQYFSGGKHIRLFNLDAPLSPYLRSLKEFRAFDYEKGDVALLEQLLNSSRFAVNREDEQQVVIENAGVAIEQVDSLKDREAAGAPDHLARLFAYNHILQKAGTSLLAGDQVPDEVIAEAEQAYIVTPASSLIVLEKQQDYDQFDIKASKNSLQNATLHSNGAVPEPHEWALIILVLLLAAGVKFRPQLALIRKK